MLPSARHRTGRTPPAARRHLSGSWPRAGFSSGPVRPRRLPCLPLRQSAVAPTGPHAV